jgi:hypothetical protein
MSSAAALTTVARHMLGITQLFQDLLGLLVESIVVLRREAHAPGRGCWCRLINTSSCFVSREFAPLACSVLLR